MLMIWLIISFLIFSLCRSEKRIFCPCEKDQDFQKICEKGKEVVTEQAWLACYCLCPTLPEIKVHYPNVIPPKWDKYHLDQIRFFNLLHNKKLLESGGILLAGWGDGGTVSEETRNRLRQFNIIFASHSLLKAHRGTRTTKSEEEIDCSYCPCPKLKHVFPSIYDNFIFIPDHLFIRNDGFRGLIDYFDQKRKENLTFSERKPSIFWRGSPNAAVYGEIRNHRFQMCLLSKNLSWMDVGLTKAYNTESERLYTSEQVIKAATPEQDWIHSRGILDIDGSVNAWGLIWRLGCGSTVFLVESNYTNAYMERLVPYQHYIPLKTDFSDFQQMTQLITQPNMIPFLERIALNARKLVEQFTLEKEIARVARELNYYWDESVMKIVDRI